MVARTHHVCMLGPVKSFIDRTSQPKRLSEHSQLAMDRVTNWCSVCSFVMDMTVDRCGLRTLTETLLARHITVFTG